MKKIVFVLCLLMLLVSGIYAQTAIEPETPDTTFIVDLGTFTGIVALISTIVTQILKIIPAIKESKAAKIGVSVAIGVIVCMLSWILQLTPLLTGVPWWESALYGIAAGLSGCGFYDVVKAIGSLFGRNKAVMLE